MLSSHLADVIIIVFVILCAAVLGSFANVLVYRLPLQILKPDHQSNGSFNIAVPSSHCPSCQTPLKWWHNIPLLSFILLRGRCAFCQAAIGWRYFWIELGTVALAVACMWLFGVSTMALAAFAFVYILWVLSWIDAQHGLLPDVLTLGLLISGLLLKVWFTPWALLDAVFGAALGYALLWLPYMFYLKWRGVVGLGLGDCKLLAAVGAWLGWAFIPMVALVASVLGLSYGVLLFVRSRSESMLGLGAVQIPFGPFIAIASVVVALGSSSIMRLVPHMFGS